ncbi:hypothetical protein [Psychrobacter sp. I-STPA6b]|uniref:hypothetical protein n=1 Tax=Psychrobacter sp. I-STPA6b TaxID=2585718 RepID=UPI001D0CBAED|nr:hypothetical protein [Psychrobacter sp. I-STPA6b]
MSYITMPQVVSNKPSSRIAQLGYSVNILLLFALAVVLTAVITMVFAHKFGYYRGYQAAQSQAKIKAQGIEMTEDDIEALQLKAQIAQKELDAAIQERDISLRNLTDQRQAQQDLEVKNLQLEQLNKVYAEALAKEGGMPLQIIGAMIQPLPEHAFEYRFDVAMLASDGKEKRLNPTLTLLDETSLVSVPLDPSSYDIKGVSHIRGRFKMPEGFVPKQVKLNLSAGGESVEQLYNWRLSAPIKDMPLSLAEIPEPDQRPITDE